MQPSPSRSTDSPGTFRISLFVIDTACSSWIVRITSTHAPLRGLPDESLTVPERWTTGGGTYRTRAKLMVTFVPSVRTTGVASAYVFALSYHSGSRAPTIEAKGTSCMGGWQ